MKTSVTGIRPHLDNLLSGEASDESINGSQVTSSCEGQASDSSFIQLLQLCHCVQLLHHAKQGFCIWMAGKGKVFFVVFPFLADNLQHPGTLTDLRPKTREPLFFLHKAVERLESQVQSLVPRYFPEVIHRQQVVVQQSLTHWFLQFISKPT